MSLDKLPLEVQQHILNELDFKQLLLLRRTSRFFYSLIANGEVERVLTIGSLDELQQKRDRATFLFLERLWRTLKTVTYKSESLEMDLSHLYVAVDFSLEAKSVAAKARVLFTAKWHKISETTRIFARSRIVIYEKDIGTAASIISSCDPLEVRVFAAASACQTPENTYPSYELYPDNVTLSKILAAGSSLDFMADGTIGFAPDDDYDRYLFSEPPHDISASLNLTASAVEFTGSERGNVLVTAFTGEPNIIGTCRDISSYLKMLSRRWNDIHSKAKQSHSISVSLPTPPYDM